MIYRPIDPDTLRPLVGFGVLVILITLAGTAGYMVIEGWSFLDSLYMVIITLSTVGFSEVHPLSTGGQLLTAGLILAGVGAVGYFIGSVSQHIISGALTGTFWSRRMQRNIDAMANHIVVCGYGRVGQQVVRNFAIRKKQLVIVEQDDSKFEEPGRPWSYVLGDASDDEVLSRAGIERASGLVVVTGDDATNLFITLSARSLNEKATIITRANSESTEPKLIRAGATHVISPYHISGNRIATQMLNPEVTAFMDEVMHSPDLELWFEDMKIEQGSQLIGQTVEEIAPQARTGANVIAIRRAAEGGSVKAELKGLAIMPGDILIALGNREQLDSLTRMCGS